MWPRLFGPVLFYDLVATTRRGRYVLFRVLYASGLAAILLVMYYETLSQDSAGFWGNWRVPPAQRQEIVRLNDSFFQRFMLLEFLAIVLLTPSVTAGAIAEDKERRSLEFLLATDLRSSEIVLGKLVSRLAFMTLLVLTGLPILGLLQLLGGVEPSLILAGFAAAALMLFSVASLSMLNSVIADKPRTAIFLTYLELTLYFIASIYLPHLWKSGALPSVVTWFCTGNIYTALSRLQTALATSGTLLAGLPNILGEFAQFHLVLGTVCLVASVGGLRLWSRRQASGPVRREAFWKSRNLPPVGNQPVLWKELYAEPLYRLHRGGSIVLTTVSASLAVFGGLLVFALIYLQLAAGTTEEKIQGIARLMTMIVASLALLATAMRASGAFAGERDRQTFDSLLTTPLRNRTIVWGKWLGSVLSVRKAWACLVALWLLATVTGAMGFFAVPWLLLACLVYSCFAASVGLWCSLHCRTTLRATVCTLLVLVVTTVGHHLLTWACTPFVSARYPVPIFIRGGLRGWQGGTGLAPPNWLLKLKVFQTYALTPPQALSWLASQYTEYSERRGPELPYLDARYGDLFLKPMEMVSAGLVLYAVAAGVLLQRVHARFARLTGRLPLRGKMKKPLAG